jgi:phage protein D
MRPAFRILAGARDVTAALADRLLDLEICDESEDKSDRLTIRLDDRARPGGGVANLPFLEDALEVSIGYVETGLSVMGLYLVDEISMSSPPAEVEIKARSADMVSEFRTQRSRSWHDTTIGEIAAEIAGRAGYELKIDPELASVPISHIDQTEESDMGFLNRIARWHDAVAKPTNGYLVVAPRGTGKSVAGVTLPSTALRPRDVARWNFTYAARREDGEAGGTGRAGKGSSSGAATDATVVDFTGLGIERSGSGSGGGGGGSGSRRGGVRAFWWDRDAGERREVRVGQPPYRDLRYDYRDAGEAAGAAAAAFNLGERGKAELSIECEGNPNFIAEAPLDLIDWRPGVPTAWRVTSVTHRIGRSGYRCAIKAELFDEERQAHAAKASKGEPAPSGAVVVDFVHGATQ